MNATATAPVVTEHTAPSATERLILALAAFVSTFGTASESLVLAIFAALAEKPVTWKEWKGWKSEMLAKSGAIGLCQSTLDGIFSRSKAIYFNVRKVAEVKDIATQYAAGQYLTNLEAAYKLALGEVKPRAERAKAEDATLSVAEIHATLTKLPEGDAVQSVCNLLAFLSDNGKLSADHISAVRAVLNTAESKLPKTSTRRPAEASATK